MPHLYVPQLDSSACARPIDCESLLTVVDPEEVGSVCFKQKSPIIFIGSESPIPITRVTNCRVYWRICAVDENPKCNIGIRKIA